MRIENIKRFYNFSFWMGILYIIISFYILFFNPLNIDYRNLKEKNINLSSYLCYKIGAVSWNISGMESGIVIFIFYLLFFIFYLLFFFISNYRIRNDFSSQDVLKKTKIFFIGSLLLYLFIILIPVFPNFVNIYSDDIELNKLYPWLMTLSLFVFALNFCQKLILNNFKIFTIFFRLLFIIPLGLFIYFRDMTLLDLQFLYFLNINKYGEPWIYYYLIFCPITYLAMPLYFSFNHYITTKKLIMENTKEDITWEFYNFEFNKMIFSIIALALIIYLVFYVNLKNEYEY